ncbi:MAG: hypothetical protein LBE09_04945 [Christensenellaceae bacterium]|jgi:hypothetical protein|nr:hypothetical protein [Christensenellaceae bacterium]
MTKKITSKLCLTTIGLVLLFFATLLIFQVPIGGVASVAATLTVGTGSGSANDPTVAEAKAYVDNLSEVKYGSFSVVTNGYKVVYINGSDGAKELQVLLKKKTVSQKDKTISTRTISSSQIGHSYSFSVGDGATTSQMRGGLYHVGGGGTITTDYVDLELMVVFNQEITRTNTTGNGCLVAYTIPNVTSANVGTYALIQRNTGREYILLKFRAGSVTRTEDVKDNSGNVTGTKQVHDHYAFKIYSNEKFYSIETQYFTWAKA